MDALNVDSAQHGVLAKGHFIGCALASGGLTAFRSLPRIA
jgi:hypothetical protein